MKTLINKILLTSMVTAGSLGIFNGNKSYGQKTNQDNFMHWVDSKDKKDTAITFKRYNKENQQVYKEFLELIKQKGKYSPNSRSYHFYICEEIDNPNSTIEQNINEFGGIYAKVNKSEIYLQKIEIMENEFKNTISFRDSFSDGLFKRDLWMASIEGRGMIVKIIQEPYNSFDLYLAKEYTNTLKEIMDKIKKSFKQDSLPISAEADLERIKQIHQQTYKDFLQFVENYPKIIIKDIINLKSLDKQIKKYIKELPKEKQLEYEKDYLESAIKLMYKSNYKNYDTLDLKFLDKSKGVSKINKKTLEELGREEQYTRASIDMLKTAADNLEYKKFSK